MVPYPAMVAILQIIPAIILIGYGLIRQKKHQPYVDILLMILPATLFYGMIMNLLPKGFFEWYLYFFAKVILVCV